MLRCSTRVLLIYDIFKYQAGSITQRTLALMYGQSNIVVFFWWEWSWHDRW